ncbi:MAG: hypothetical protein JW834_02320 [Candidatus Diapherotrites archaeon]|nr:hypothetical protein [Candidatus Diapherotrites archaeon]
MANEHDLIAKTLVITGLLFTVVVTLVTFLVPQEMFSLEGLGMVLPYVYAFMLGSTYLIMKGFKH